MAGDFFKVRAVPRPLHRKHSFVSHSSSAAGLPKTFSVETILNTPIERPGIFFVGAVREAPFPHALQNSFGRFAARPDLIPNQPYISRGAPTCPGTIPCRRYPRRVSDMQTSFP